MNKKGFTLIELLVVIAIIAVLTAFAAANFVGVRSRAKDLRKKAELSQLKNALRLYYNDYMVYPGPAGTLVTNTLYGCGTGTPPATDCWTPSVCDGQFAAGPTGCDTMYMKLLPLSSDYTWYYRQRSNGDNFCLWAALENTSDAEIAKSQARCSTICAADALTGSNYALCAD